MIERVTFAPEADNDVASAYEWYESREPGLGEDFLRWDEGGRDGKMALPGRTARV